MSREAIMRRIFTFWENPRGLPGYLKLCLETWRKFLPEYEIVVLNYANLDQWIGQDCYDPSLYINFSLPKQADAVRCAVLKRWGGVWFDADTIVTSDKAGDLLNQESDFVLLGTHIGFIVARKNAYVLRKWEQGIKWRILAYKFCRDCGLKGRRLERWDYMGNLILNDILKKCQTLKEFKSLDRKKIKAPPEVNSAAGPDARPSLMIKAGMLAAKLLLHIGQKPFVIIGAGLEGLMRRMVYRDFYFGRDASDYALGNSGGLICLHHSWTPGKYKNMSQDEFLRQNITLANIFKKLL